MFDKEYNDKFSKRKAIYAKHRLHTEWVKKTGCAAIFPINNKGISWEVIEKTSIFKTKEPMPLKNNGKVTKTK